MVQRAINGYNEHRQGGNTPHEPISEELESEGFSSVSPSRGEDARAGLPLAQNYRRQLEAVCNNATVALFIMDERQQCIYMNPAAENLTGYTLAEVHGRALHDVVHHTHPDGRPYPLEECPIDRALPQNNQEQGEEVFVHKNGSFYPVAFTASPIREDGVPVGTIIEVRGLSEERRAQRERERFFNIALDLLCIADTDGSFKRVNPAWTHTLGWSEEELLNRPLVELIHPDDLAATREEAENLRSSGRTLYFENRYRHRDGSYRWLAWSAALFEEDQLIYAAAHDVTARRAHERTLQFLVDLNHATQPLADPGEVMLTTARLLGEYLGVNRCAYAEVGPDQDSFYIPGDYTQGTHSIVGDFTFSQFGADVLRLMRAGEAYVVENSETDARTQESLESYRATEIAAVICVPLHKEGVFVAAMAVHQKTPRAWSSEEIELVEVVVNGCWEAIERARVVRALQAAHVQLEARVAQRTRELSSVVARLQAEAGERERAEKSLQREREYLRATLENIEDGVVACDADGVLTFFNRATRDFHGMSESPIPSEEWAGLYDLYHGDGVTPLVKSEVPLFRALQGEFVKNAEVVIAPVNGTPRQLLVSGRALFGEDGEKMGAVVVMHDVTGQRAAEGERENLIKEREARRAAEEANRLKDEFLATVSHELRTPIQAVLGWAHLLRTSDLDGETASRALETIERNAQSQVRLIEDLLDVSRIITGKLRLDVRPVMLSTVVDAAADAVRPAAAAKEIRLQMLLDPQAGPVLGDPDRLQQVVWNLLSNAIKFTPPGGCVQTRVERSGSHVEITVTDTGQGIQTEFLPHVFDHFRQADGSSTRNYGGLGLGLAIVRQLVELHGGSVSVSSPGEGCGSTFVVTLPILVAHRATETAFEDGRLASSNAEGRMEFVPPPALRDLRVLVVDDETDARQLLAAVLESCGSRVTTAASVEEALELFARARPDVLISDLGMPEQDGYALIEKVRALPPEEGGRVPAVALTAYARAEDRLKVLASGFQMHVPKPVEPAEIAAVVASLTTWVGRT